MTFQLREESEEQAVPTSLYLIEYGGDANAFFAYTDSEMEVVFGGKTYIPTVIGRQEIESSGTLDKTTLEVEITPNAGVVDLYMTGVPSHVVGMTIFQGHVDDPDNEFIAVWTGRIISINIGSRYATIAGQPVSTSMKRAGLRRHYQYGCPFALYGPHCQADQVAATESGTVAAVGGNFIDLAEGWNGERDKLKFQGGFVQWTDPATGISHTRTTLKVTPGVPDRLLINGNTTGLLVAATVSVVLGCNHQTTDCSELHDNILNYGGQPYIPKENPTGFRNMFY